MGRDDTPVESGDVTIKKPSLSTRILIGLLAGIACGLVFGEYCGVLAVVGEAFIDLLQMTILPYITAALVLNIGRLSAGRARRLAGSAGVVLLGLWAVAAVIVVAVPQAFPDIRQGAFFSAEMIQPAASFDPLEVYIPDNPFHSLANNVVPAVVLFSICLGVALIGIERKQTLLDLLDTTCQALTRVSSFVVRLTPYGIFAGTRPDVAALITTAEAGSAWTLIHPSYQVVVPTEAPIALPLVYPVRAGPTEAPIALPLVYPVRAGDVEFRRLVEDWAALVAMDGTADELYDYWILGGGARTIAPRWSVIRDILHWVE